MKLHKDSHLDHGLSAAQLAHVLLTFEPLESFFIETITLPEALGTVPCALFGPVMGDGPIPGALVTMQARGDRKYKSCMLSAFDPVGTDWMKINGRHINVRERRTSEITVIAGPHDGHPCVLFTVFGGPLTPKEPGDPTLTDDKRAESIKFWAQHALAF